MLGVFLLSSQPFTIPTKTVNLIDNSTNLEQQTYIDSYQDLELGHTPQAL